MKLLSVHINNFMAIGEADIKLSDRGLVLVQGDNQDESSAVSNGAGKSSFADALCWCLYGVTARGEEGDKIVNRFVGKNCYVEVYIEDGAEEYRVVRHRKHKTHKNSLQVHANERKGAGTDLTKGTEKLTQAVVNQIIGCSYEVFTGAVYAGQERMPDLPGMTDKNLKMLIEEASGATLLETAYVEAQARLRTRKSEVDAAVAMVERSRSGIDDAIERQTDAVAGEAQFETDRIDAVKAIHARAKITKDAADKLKVVLDASVQPATLQTAIKSLDAAISAVVGERATEKALADKVTAAERAFALRDSVVRTAEAAVTSATKALKGVEHQVGCPCSTCARPYSATDIAPAKKIAEANLKARESELSEARTQLGPVSALVLSVTDALEKHRASMTDISATNAERTKLQAELGVVTQREAEHKTLVAAVAAAVEQIKAKKAEINPFILRIKAAEKALAEAENKLKENEATLTRVTAGLKVAEVTAKVFSPAGVRAFLLDEVTPFLNDQTAKYLGTLSDGHIQATWTTLVKTAKGELREKFSIEVTNSTGGDSFGLISGGEKRKVRIACALALQDLVARRATKPIELFVGDEIDDALDPAGIERLTTILEEKARERGSVFIISHSDLQCWVRNVITVTKKGEISTFEDVVV